MTDRALLPLSLALSLGGVLVGCPNDHVFIEIPQCATKVLQQDTPIDLAKAADILIVVDNSGSMCEEQANLVENFYDPDCPLTDLRNIPEEYKNPSAEQVTELSQSCGFIQILAAYDNDFRVGVITTDVGLCDNRYGFADEIPNNPSLCNGQLIPDWGRRPQRGCLQRPPGAEKRFISRDDEDDIGIRFTETLANIQTFGSGFERGLDAVRIFLSPNATKHPDCEDDLESFVRDDASLIIIYLTDEDDCSHPVSEGFPDEDLGDDDCSVKVDTSVAPPVATSTCYTNPDLLSDVQGYADFLRAYKGPQREQDVRLAVIAGATKSADDETSPAGCRVVDGAPDGVCFESQGNSNYTTAPNATCNPDRLEAAGLPPCCQADPGTRYYALADKMPPGQAFTDSICFASFRDTMVEIAKFAARVEFVELGQPPANRAAIIVKVKRGEGAEFEVVERIPDGADPSGKSGWQLEGADGTRIRFHGDAIPQPGDEISVSALATLENGNDDACAGDFDETATE